MDHYAIYCRAFYCDGDQSPSSVTTGYLFFFSWSGVAKPFYTAVSVGPIVPSTDIWVWGTSGITDRRIAKWLEKISFQCHFVENNSHMDYALGSNPILCGKKQYRLT